MTIQDQFNTMVRHLRKQGQRSIEDEGDRCMYRGEGGMQCAVGCLISDDRYHEDMEGQDACTIISRWRLDINIGLAVHMQHLHDTGDPDFWETRFDGVASHFDGLTVPPID